MNRYSIVHIPKGEIEKFFIDITDELDKKFNIGNLSKKIFQHITLRYPFETDQEGIIKIEKILKEFISTQKSFNYKVEEFSKFPNDDKTIFLPIVDDTNISEFRKKMMDNFENIDNNELFLNNYHPHISIARDLNPESSGLVWEYLNNTPKPHFDLMFDSIAIIVKNEDVWSVHKVIDLC